MRYEIAWVAAQFRDATSTTPGIPPQTWFQRNFLGGFPRRIFFVDTAQKCAWHLLECCACSNII
jgi:hypothetical protein